MVLNVFGGLAKKLLLDMDTLVFINEGRLSYAYRYHRYLQRSLPEDCLLYPFAFMIFTLGCTANLLISLILMMKNWAALDKIKIFNFQSKISVIFRLYLTLFCKVELTISSLKQGFARWFIRVNKVVCKFFLSTFSTRNDLQPHGHGR